MNKFEQISIDGNPCLIGDPPLLEEPFFSLKVGDKITQIGDGRQSSTHRTLYIEPYMTYSGAYDAKDGTKYFVFKIPPERISGWNLFNTKKNIYMCFLNIENHLIGLQHFNFANCFCYAPFFKHSNP